MSGALSFALAAAIVVAPQVSAKTTSKSSSQNASMQNASAQNAAMQKPVKLAVVIVIDQMRAEYLQKYARFFGPDGFNRLMKNGANLQNAHYSHATTYTGPGHALILSGTYGHSSGIIGNRWFNRATNRVESMFFDADAKLLGVEAVPKDDDTSPRNFIGSNLSDQLRLSNNMRSKVVAVSNKDRAAIMLAGKLGKAFWYHEGVGGMTSSTFYGADLPLWVKSFNARKIPDSFFGKVWNRALAPIEYSISRADNDPNETDFKGLGKTFPHTLSDASGKPTASFYEGFTATPFATDYQFAFAREAIAQEHLGEDDATDLLGISITAPDIAGHAYGPDSQEIQDTFVRLDGQIAAFLRDMDARFQKNDVVYVLTSDHGACTIPEYSNALGLQAARIKKKQISSAINDALTARFGAPDSTTPGANWISALEDPGIYLSRDVIENKKLDFAQVQRVAGEAALTVPGMTTFYTREAFLHGGLPDNKWAKMFEKSFHAERAGDVLLMTKPFYFWGTYGERDTGSTHGSPYEYDTHVPLIISGAGVRRGNYARNVDMADLAPTLATLLHIAAPAGNEGHVLSEIFEDNR